MKISILKNVMGGLLVLTSTLSVFSSSTTPQPEPPKEPVIIPNSNNNNPIQNPDSDRKRMPSKNDYLYFSYNSLQNECTFIIPSNIAWLDIEFITPEGLSMFAHVTSDYPTCNIVLGKGVHHIICTADDGRIFEGDVCID